MNINAIEKALVAFRDKQVTDGTKCTGLRIRIGEQSFIIGDCWNCRVDSATKAVLDKKSKTLTLSFHYESDEPRPRTEIIDCDHVFGICVESSRDSEVPPDVTVEIL